MISKAVKALYELGLKSIAKINNALRINDIMDNSWARRLWLTF